MMLVNPDKTPALAADLARDAIVSEVVAGAYSIACTRCEESTEAAYDLSTALFLARWHLTTHGDHRYNISIRERAQ